MFVQDPIIHVALKHRVVRLIGEQDECGLTTGFVRRREHPDRLAIGFLRRVSPAGRGVQPLDGRCGRWDYSTYCLRILLDLRLICISPSLECKHRIGRADVAIAVPVAFGPGRGARQVVLVLTDLEDQRHVSGVKHTVEVGVARGGVQDVQDQHIAIGGFHLPIAVQVVVRLPGVSAHPSFDRVGHGARGTAARQPSRPIPARATSKAESIPGRLAGHAHASQC